MGGPRPRKRGWDQSWSRDSYWEENCPPPPPPAKKARPSRKPVGPAVKVSGVPVEYTYDMLVEMHESFGFDYWAIKDIEFETEDETGRKKLTVRNLTVRYTDDDTARAAVEALEGQPVANRAGETLYLDAKLLKDESSPDDGASYAELDDAERNTPSRRRRDTSCSAQRGRDDFHWHDASASMVRGGGWQNRRSESMSTTRSYNSQGGRRRSGWGGGKGRDNGGSDGPPVIYPSAYISDVPVEYKDETMVQLHKACSLDPATIMGMKFLPPQDALSETCCCIVRYMDQESCDKAVGAIRGRPVLLRSGACKFFGAKMAKPARWMMDRGMKPVDGGGEKQGELKNAPGPNGEFTWCAQDKDCTGKMGSLLFEDISSGLPYCEVCWDNWHFEQGMAPGSPLEEAAEG